MLPRLPIFAGTLFGAALAAASCFSSQDDCEKNPKLNCGSFADGGGGFGTAANGGTAGDGGVGAGTVGPGGGGSGGAPDCMTDADCTNAANAQCDGGSCVPCTDNAHCEAGVADAGVCDGGTCVECLLGDEDACAGSETCDLLAKTCVGVAPGSVTNCNTCTNDVQCTTDHRCVEMEFQTAPHGYYCLKEDSGASCTEPFGTLINAPSISGAGPTDYCGIVEDLATCEAVNALLQDWRCATGMTDGMCGPVGMAEVAVPGALCRTVGGLANRCTYACSIAGQCPTAVTCGGGAPNWCGG